MHTELTAAELIELLKIASPELVQAVRLHLLAAPTVITRLRDFVSLAEQAIEAAELLEASLAPIAAQLIERQQAAEKAGRSDAP